MQIICFYTGCGIAWHHRCVAITLSSGSFYQLKTDLMNMSISADINLLSIAVADWMVELMQETLEKQDRFTLVLSGGNTPKTE